MLKKCYETERLALVQSEAALAPRVARFYCQNEAFLRPTEPAHENIFFTEDFQRRALARDARHARELLALRLWLLPRGGEKAGDIIGTAALSSIVFGAFRSAILSYKLGAAHTGQGFMREALQALVHIAFEDMGLHRLEANIMPENEPSLRLVERLGFQNEGLARRYLKINGAWRDHIHMVLLNEPA